MLPALLCVVSGFPGHGSSFMNGPAAPPWSKLNQPVQFLQKPFHPDALMTQARQVLDHRPT
jgi:hypothetical protein